MTYYSCMQCKDQASGLIGDFIHKGDKIAISPVFDNCGELFRWMRENGYHHVSAYSFEVEKE